MSSPPATEIGAAHKAGPPPPRRPPSPPASDSDTPSAIPSATTTAALHQADRHLIRQIHAGSQTTFRLSPDRFERLRPHLPEVRLDYDPEEELLLRHMPDVIHERVTDVLGDLLKAEIRKARHAVGVDARVQEALQHVVSVANTDIVNPRGSRQEWKTPDVSFRAAQGDLHPTLVCEVAYSQRRDSVEAICTRHIMRSKGAVQCAIAVNLPYATTSTGTATLYRVGAKGASRRGTAKVVQQAEFITSDGSAVEGGELVLQASDLLRLGRHEGREEADGVLLRISLQQLYNAYQQALRGRAEPTPSAKRKRDDVAELEWSSSGTDSEFHDSEDEQTSGHLVVADGAAEPWRRAGLRPRSVKRQNVGYSLQHEAEDGGTNT